MYHLCKQGISSKLKALKWLLDVHLKEGSILIKDSEGEFIFSAGWYSSIIRFAVRKPAKPTINQYQFWRSDVQIETGVLPLSRTANDSLLDEITER